jgi:hypothetical protein
MDMFNNGNNKVLQSVIDAASKILMGVQDQSVADAQTESSHPIVKAARVATEAKEVVLESGFKLGKVGGSHLVHADSSDANWASHKASGRPMDDGKDDRHHFTHNGKTIDVNDGGGKAHVKKQVAAAGVHKDHQDAIASHIHSFVNESKDMDTPAVDKALQHDCATHVVHEFYGNGECIPGMHTIEESVDGEAYVTHYDVMFQDETGAPYILEDVAVEDLGIVAEMSHGHSRKKKKM